MKKYVILLLGLVLLSGCSKESIVVKSDTFNAEYGKPLSESLATYVDYDKSDEDLKYKGKLIFDNVKMVENEDYPTLGVHKIKIQLDDETKEVSVVVKDTVSPEFVKFKETLTTYIDKPIDDKTLKESYEVKDVDEVSLELDTTNVDYTKSGKYSTKVIAKDTSGNQKSIDVKVVVKKIVFEVDKKQLNLEEDESYKLTVKKEGIEGDIKYTSSNTRIASVDKNGNVKALAEGTAKITITCGEKKLEVSVNVIDKYVPPVVEEPETNPSQSQNSSQTNQSEQKPNNSSNNNSSNQNSSSDKKEEDKNEENKKEEDKKPSSDKSDSGLTEDKEESNKKPSKEEKEESKPEEHVHADASEWVIMTGGEWWDNSKWFNSYEELDEWAFSFNGPEGDWASAAWVTIECKKCGKVLPIFYDIEKWKD